LFRLQIYKLNTLCRIRELSIL